MTIKQYLGPALAVALAVPSFALADEGQQRDSQTREERTQSQRESARAEEQQRTAEQRTTEREPRTRQDMEQYRREMRTAELREHVLPAMASIETAQISAAALHELASEAFDPQYARRNVELADQALRFGSEQVDSLREMRGLSRDERARLDEAARHLRDAHSTAQRIQESVGAELVRQQQADELRNHSEQLHTQLADAHRAIEGIAEDYQISTRFTLQEQEDEQREERG